jgi:holo-[acyl-carrier protein] synthase
MRVAKSAGRSRGVTTTAQQFADAALASEAVCLVGGGHGKFLMRGASSQYNRPMIIGMGIDVEDVERVQGAMERQGERFLRRIFTEKEQAYCEQFRDKYERYAGRFAVKEAAMKALGTGWSRGVRWVDIEVVRLHGGRPTLELQGEARKIADKLGVKNIAISITHTSKQAMAQVIFES